ncbi:uncharacterized protein LOC115047113 isoform X2 [Echeneis naucrates]|uniref:uncharacterized protein LOC115047113 isoform X2 n=1 Tax=Echeneis naucrates TaxID=173247 RepID=UPI0011139120|nr:uncharacterized protein LOC115047113 isoform X2 [Echeneis naucrates]
MSRAALTKLFILVILAFFICLPEFFTLYKVSKVNFSCQPYRPCNRGDEVEHEKARHSETERKDLCDPEHTAEWGKWEQSCTSGNESYTILDSKEGSNYSERSWFMCQADLDMEELNNISASATPVDVHLEVAVELQLYEAETLNLTLYGFSNHSSLDLHPPEQLEEEDDNEKGDEGEKALYCCLPAQPSLESASQSRCLLRLANQTVLTATAKEKLPWKRTQRDEWWCIFRVLWLSLLCVVLLTTVTTVLRQIYLERHLCKKSMVPPVHNFKGGDVHTEISPKEKDRHVSSSWIWSDLSPIEEESHCQENTETLLDGNVDAC